MPTETFKNLNDEKKQNILNAARNEFSKVSFSESSINKIIKEAGISRGSFYMYFIDKEDLYETVIENQLKKNFKFLKDELVKNNGDIFKTYINIYEILLKKVSKNKTNNFNKYILLNMNFKSDNLFIRKNKVQYKKYIEEFISLINTNNYKLEDKEELLDIIDMLTLLLIHSLVKSLKNPSEVKVRYIRQVSIIERSIKER